MSLVDLLRTLRNIDHDTPIRLIVSIDLGGLSFAIVIIA